jgi:hypothetical protein
MKRGDAFPAARLKSEDIKGKRVRVVIEEIKIEEVGQGEDREKKPVAYFQNKEKSMVLNVTNWNRLEEFLGSDDSDDWIGQSIVLGTERVEFQGKRVDGLRVLSGGGSPAPPVQPEPEPAAEDDSVPF